MYEYIKGKIKSLESNYVVLENNGIGYLIFTANPYSYVVDKEYTMYLYQYIREDENSLYGFKSKEEKSLFLKLIGVKGLGCKVAMAMLNEGAINGIIDAIERENILYLKKFPKVGDKLARQIILDLKGKLASNKQADSSNYNELIEALKALGYKVADINKILKEINPDDKIEIQIKNALKLLLK